MELTMKDLTDLMLTTNNTMRMLFSDKDTEWLNSQLNVGMRKVRSCFEFTCDNEVFKSVLSNAVKCALNDYLLADTEEDLKTLFRYEYLRVFNKLVQELELVRMALNNK